MRDKFLVTSNNGEIISLKSLQKSSPGDPPRSTGRLAAAAFVCKPHIHANITKHYTIDSVQTHLPAGSHRRLAQQAARGVCTECPPVIDCDQRLCIILLAITGRPLITERARRGCVIGNQKSAVARCPSPTCGQRRRQAGAQERELGGW